MLCRPGLRLSGLLLTAVLFSAAALSQNTLPNTPPPGQLDPTRALSGGPQLFSSFHQPLPEQYIWTREDSTADKSDIIHYSMPGSDQQIAPHYFRVHFHLDSVPDNATLYLAGPRSATVSVNGTAAGRFVTDPMDRLSIQVFHVDAAHYLRPGDNVIAMEVVRGYGNAGFLNSGLAMQQAFGNVLVAKLIPAAPGVLAAPILISGPEWKASLQASDGWQKADFNDSSWPAAEALSPIEGSIDLFQWNADAGLYDWPGYEGESPFLAHTFFPAEKTMDIYAGQGSFDNLDALTGKSSSEFTVHLADSGPGNQFVPAVTLDFGREVTGRVQLISDSDAPATVSIAYGESIGELNDEPYLGIDPLTLPPHETGAGPKSAFRYARIRFLAGPPELRFKSIRLEDVYYPVHYQGSFESSDALLNRVWETGAYTSHLCMQDDIWDAPKRDRGRWMGDTDVSGRVIDAVFDDHFLLEDTLTRLIGPLPIQQHVNGIPGYSSYWFTELADYLRHSGRKEYVASMHDRIVQMLEFMEKDFDQQNHFINQTKAWLYVDWALDLNGDTPQARETTVLEYIRAYRDGAWLLRQLGDTQNADRFARRAEELSKVSQSSDWSGGSFGPRWQTNAMAVISGVASPDQYGSIWQNVLSSVGKPTFRPNIISPYYGTYVLEALAEMHHRADALAWIREYWGGMVQEGATSFWEAYDPSWPKDDDPHVDLQADNTAGYRISLAHGWSSAPTFWLMEQVLGIQPTAPGFSQTTLRPDLLDLAWARGAEPTPNGPLKVDLRQDQTNHHLHAVIDVPSRVEATVLFPVSSGADHILVNGASKSGTPAENGARLAVVLDQPGHYELHAE